MQETAARNHLVRVVTSAPVRTLRDRHSDGRSQGGKGRGGI
jgi:hypothetical protein